MVTRITQTKKRKNLINFIYKYELLEEDIDITDAFENYEFSENQIKQIKYIKANYLILKKSIIKFFKKNWEWERLQPLERAILLVGSFELTFLDKGIVINEMIEYTKKYIIGDKYKFINSILEKVSTLYEQTKKQKF